MSPEKASQRQGNTPEVKFYDTPTSLEPGADPSRPEVVEIRPDQTGGILADEVMIVFPNR
jgi:hypothetical protein